MKKFKKLIKCMTLAFAVCFMFSAGILAKANVYQPGELYINPTENSKYQTYSVLKQRMNTASSAWLRVIYPKGAELAVKSSKKDLQAVVTQQDFGYTTSKVYVAGPNVEGATITETEWYYVEKDGTELWLNKDTETNTYYYQYDSKTKIPFTPNKIVKEASDAYEIKEDTYSYKVDLYDAGDGKGWYYYSYPNQIQSYIQAVPFYEYEEAYINLVSTKAGTYTVTVSAGGKTQKVKVFVVPDNSNVYSSITLDKKNIYTRSRKNNDNSGTTTGKSDYKVSSSLKSGKLKLKANKGYKITGMIVAYIDKDGKAAFKKVKNGAKIPLSQEVANKSTDPNGSYSKDSRKYTYVYISYKDTYTGEAYTYSIVNKHGIKQIKEVHKKVGDSKGYVNYLYWNNSGLSLWSY